MSTTIVFACKSNSCRSQMAEAWAHEWIKTERLGIEERKQDEPKCYQGGDDHQLSSFLDGLMVVSVALDESSVAKPNEKNSMNPSLSSNGTSLSSSPTSSLTTKFEPNGQCVTCVGEQMCTSSSQRRKPKEKAIFAMAEDGVDISSYFAKTFTEILPFVLNKQQQRDLSMRPNHFSWKGMCRVLEMASREMVMAYAGVQRGNSESKLFASDDSDKEPQVVDSLIVLCTCPQSMKRRLSDMSKETFDWEIDPPTAAAKSEGDGAYLRVSRQIREKVDDFLDELKRCAMIVGKDSDCWSADLGENSKACDNVLAPPLSAPS